jgi:hypothetical protein
MPQQMQRFLCQNPNPTEQQITIAARQIGQQYPDALRSLLAERPDLVPR